MWLARNSGKGLGALCGILAVLAVAGLWTVRAAAGPEPVYHVAGDSDADAATLRAAIDPLFDDAVGETRALVIMHDGEIVAERYAPGYGPRTKLPSWSAAKSVTAEIGRAHV